MSAEHFHFYPAQIESNEVRPYLEKKAAMR